MSTICDEIIALARELHETTNTILREAEEMRAFAEDARAANRAEYERLFGRPMPVEG